MNLTSLSAMPFQIDENPSGAWRNRAAYGRTVVHSD